MASLSPTPKLQFFSGGSPLVGGKLYTYAAGTTTPLATYTDSTGGTPNTNPVIMDARGEASVWLSTSLYYMELKDSTGALIWTADNVGGAATLSDLASTAISSGIALIGNAIQRVANISTLRTIAVTTSRDIETQGYYTAGDGGHGTYYGVTGAAAGTYVDNGGTIIVPTGGDGSSAWLLKKISSINVKCFGAKGDGVTDDTAKLQAAIDYVNSIGGMEIYLPAGTYNIGANTLLMKSQVILRGDGTIATIIKSSSFVLDYGSWATGGTQNAKLYSLQLLCTGTNGCIALRGRAGGTSATGEIWAYNVYFNGDQSIVIDQTHFNYSGFWNIDKCIFKKYLHLSTTAAVNGDGTGMLINTIRILNSTFGTVGYDTDYAIKLASVSNPNGVNQTLIKGCVFEQANLGGIYYIGGNQHAFEDNWFADATTTRYTVDIAVDASFVSIFNVFDRGSGNAKIRNLSSGPVSIKNCNLLTGADIEAPVAAGSLPRVAIAHSPLTGPLLHCLNQDGNGDIYLSSRKPQGLRTINILIPPTAAGATVAIPIPAEYSDSLFKRIIAWKMKNGDTAMANPGASYTLAVRFMYGAGPSNLLAWTNANTAVAAFDEVTLNSSGVYTGADFTNYLDATQRSQSYIDLLKAGAGCATGYMYITLYVM